MADKKISQLNGATTPVAGTEVLPIVQSSSTVKVSIDNLTKGRVVNALSFDTDVAAAGVTLSGVTLSADGTNSDIDINVTPKGTGEVNITKVDIDSGAIDGTAIGASSASTGAFTTLSASSTVSGTGFSTYLASPPAIGGTAAAAGTFTTLTSAADNNIAISGKFIRTKSATVVGQAAATTFFTIAMGNFTCRAIRLGVLSRLNSGDGGSRVWYRESVFVETGGAALTESNITNITGANGTLAFSVSGTTISVTMYSNATAGVNETCEMALEILSRSPGTITTN